MGKPWSTEHRRKFLATMKRLYPHGTKSKQHRAKLARDPQRFQMVQFRVKKPNGTALQEALATLRTERVRVVERLGAIDRAVHAITSLTQEQK